MKALEAMVLAASIALSSCAAPKAVERPESNDIRARLSGHLREVKPLDDSYAVIVVDMQEKFWNYIKPPEREEELGNQINVLKYCKKHDIPVVVLEYVGPYGDTIGPIKEAVEKVPRHTYLKKNGDNGFTNTWLEEELKHWGVENIFLMGVNASACVKATGIGALYRGFNIATSPEVISDSYHYLDGESLGWYVEHGLFSYNYEDFIK